MPEDRTDALLDALASDQNAARAWDDLPEDQQHEYAEWVAAPDQRPERTQRATKLLDMLRTGRGDL